MTPQTSSTGTGSPRNLYQASQMATRGSSVDGLGQPNLFESNRSVAPRSVLSIAAGSGGAVGAADVPVPVIFLQSEQLIEDPTTALPEAGSDQNPALYGLIGKVVAEAFADYGIFGKTIATRGIQINLGDHGILVKILSEAVKTAAEGFKTAAEGFKTIVEGGAVNTAAEMFKTACEGFKITAEGFKIVAEGFKLIAAVFSLWVVFSMVKEILGM